MASGFLKRWVAPGALAFALLAALTARSAPRVGSISIDGPIGPATADYIERAIDQAALDKDDCLVIQLDTPGGLLDSTKAIVEKLFSDKVPTIVYVTPSGATAASAGTFITLAADVAAMAPNTTIGAAHPVTMGGGSEDTNSVMGLKMENYSAAFIESIADKRHHNIEWAKSAVRQSASITAAEALKLGVVDLIAPDIPSLLRQLNGRTVGGRLWHTANAVVVPISMAPREWIFQMLWRPEVIFILMLAAVYGLIGEFSHPGAVLPGIVGAISLILALYLGSILPVNIAGLGLILVALALFIIDVYAPTHGILTVGGAVAFFFGCLMLFDRSPAFALPLSWVAPGAVVTALFFFFVVGAGLRAQRLPAKTGREIIVGQIVNALTQINPRGGQVFMDGEYWQAVSQADIAPGAAAEVVGREGLVLRVKPKI